MNWNPFNIVKKKRIADMRARIRLLNKQLDFLKDISRCRENQFDSLFRSYVDQYGEDNWPESAMSMLETMNTMQRLIYKETEETFEAIHTLAVELRNSLS